ncbi:MAG: RraA family protein [Candidatus Acidiferrales bacterium]
MTPKVVSTAHLEQLRRLSTCVVASAIERFGVRLRNTGFADSGVRCIFKDLPTTVGYATTARIRTSDPPMEGRSYYDRTDWWNHLLTMPSPRIVVIEDMDDPPGLGAFVGEVHANILVSLGCAGLVTNGAVRDIEDVRKAGFPLFAGNISVSHGYAHVFDFGSEVTVGGLKIKPGDLIQADRHGVQTVPLEIAEKVPAAAEEILQIRRTIIGLCRSSDFSIEKLRKIVHEIGT